MTTLESLARTIAAARHGTDAMWANYLTSAEAVEKMMSEPTEARHLKCKCGQTKLFPVNGYHEATSLTCDKCGYSVGLFQSNWPPAEQERPTEAPETSETPSGWQPIETAPKDRGILAYNPMVGPYQSAYRAVAGIDDEWPCFLWGERPGTWYPVPTHWMELPEPPK